MNEPEFKSKWEAEKAKYAAWGHFIISALSESLEQQGIDIAQFIKVPAHPRLKTEKSLIDKAFYRNKSYTDPFDEIEDKVGIRFVVLLIADIQTICDAVESNAVWNFDPCKHFDEDKEKEPLLFTYQSVHYILRPKKLIKIGDITIPVILLVSSKLGRYYNMLMLN